MKTQLVRIGNSRGVLLPKALIKQAGLTDEIKMEARGNTIVILAKKGPRAGWPTGALGQPSGRTAREPTFESLGVLLK